MGTRIAVTVVETGACPLCDDAVAFLTELAARTPIRIRRVAASSAEGREVVATHRPAMFPVVLVDGQLVSCGRLSRGRLRRILLERGGGAGS